MDYPAIFVILMGLGTVFFGLGAKIRYMHSVFHLFVVAASLCHFFAIFFELMA